MPDRDKSPMTFDEAMAMDNLSKDILDIMNKYRLESKMSSGRSINSLIRIMYSLIAQCSSDNRIETKYNLSKTFQFLNDKCEKDESLKD